MSHPLWDATQDALDWRRPPTDKTKKIRYLILGSVVVITLLFVFSSLTSSSPAVLPPVYSAMTVLHIVAFKLADPAKLPALNDAMLALKRDCVRKDGTRYIVSAVGGKQTNKEGHDGGMQVVFVMEFENQQDADYYIEHDPVHNVFKDKLGTWGLDGVTVLDFTPRAF